MDRRLAGPAREGCRLPLRQCWNPAKVVVRPAAAAGATIVVCPPKSTGAPPEHADDPESSAALDERVSREAASAPGGGAPEADAKEEDEEGAFAVLHGQVPAKRLASGGVMAEAVEYDGAEGSRRGGDADDSAGLPLTV